MKTNIIYLLSSPIAWLNLERGERSTLWEESCERKQDIESPYYRSHDHDVTEKEMEIRYFSLIGTAGSLALMPLLIMCVPFVIAYGILIVSGDNQWIDAVMFCFKVIGFSFGGLALVECARAEIARKEKLSYYLTRAGERVYPQISKAAHPKTIDLVYALPFIIAGFGPFG